MSSVTCIIIELVEFTFVSFVRHVNNSVSGFSVVVGGAVTKSKVSVLVGKFGSVAKFVMVIIVLVWTTWFGIVVNIGAWLVVTFKLLVGLLDRT